MRLPAVDDMLVTCRSRSPSRFQSPTATPIPLPGSSTPRASASSSKWSPLWMKKAFSPEVVGHVEVLPAVVVRVEERRGVAPAAVLDTPPPGLVPIGSVGPGHEQEVGGAVGGLVPDVGCDLPVAVVGGHVDVELAVLVDVGRHRAEADGGEGDARPRKRRPPARAFRRARGGSPGAPAGPPPRGTRPCPRRCRSRGAEAPCRWPESPAPRRSWRRESGRHRCSGRGSCGGPR